MFLDNLSSAVLRLCDEKELTYEKASERCHISTRYFGDIARCKRAPSVLTLEKLCTGLEVTPNDLLLLQEENRELSFRHALPVVQIRQYQGYPRKNEYPVCPRCKVTLEREYQEFCDRCGQCLDWGMFSKAEIIVVE